MNTPLRIDGGTKAPCRWPSNEPATDADLEPDMLTSDVVAKMDSREHYQADDLMKSIKARSGNPAPSASLMVVSLPPPRGYRVSEAAAALNVAGALALPHYCVGFDAKIGYPKGWRKV